MNTENPVQIDLFGVYATGTKDTRTAEHIGGSCRCCAWLTTGTPGRFRPGGRPHSRGRCYRAAPAT